jgi:hypothetical protein
MFCFATHLPRTAGVRERTENFEKKLTILELCDLTPKLAPPSDAIAKAGRTNLIKL